LPEKKIVLDTTICIDLSHGHLLKKTTELPSEFLLADVIVEELINPPGKVFVQAGFSISKISEEAIGKIFELRTHYPKPSTNDLFAFLLAKINSCPLLTGDDALSRSLLCREDGSPFDSLHYHIVEGFREYLIWPAKVLVFSHRYPWTSLTLSPLQAKK
jgi:hypothetical protein